MSDMMLYEEYKDLCLAEAEYKSLEDSREIPRWLTTVVGGDQNLFKNKSAAGKYTGKFSDAILTYEQKFFLEENKPLGADFEMRKCINLFRNILVVSITPPYDAAKKKYATMIPLVRPIAIPLVKVRSGKSSSVTEADGTVKYLFTITFEDDSTFEGLLFTVKDGQVGMDQNWTLCADAVLFKECIKGDVLAVDEIDGFLAKIEEMFATVLENRFDFEERRGVIKELFEECVWDEFSTKIYSTEYGFADLFVNNLDQLQYTMTAKELNSAIKPHLAAKAEAEKERDDKLNQHEKMRRKLWGQSLLKQRRMKVELMKLSDDAKKAQKRADAELDMAREACLEILDNM